MKGSHGADPDAELMLAARDGDGQAFAELFRRHSRAMVHFAHRFVGDRGRAEELAQDVFLKLHRALPSYEPSAKFKTFLYRIASNHCLNELRRSDNRLRAVPDPDLPAEAEPAADGPTPDEVATGHDLEKAIGAALARLPDRERVALLLCRLQGMAYREIAEALETTESAVKSLIRRGTVALARELGDLAPARLAAGEAR